MVAIRNHRIGLGGLAESPPRPAASRVVAEVATPEGGAQEVRLHRMSVSVFAKVGALVAPQRVTAEVAAEGGGAQEVRVHRIGTGGLAKSPPRLGVQRVAAEVAAGSGAAQEVRVHRISVSVLGRASLPAPQPLPLAASLDFFMQNWVARVALETAYQTNVARSPETLAEERTSRTQRPDRLIELTWVRVGDTEIRALHKLLRRLTAEVVQIPLYPDTVTITSAMTTLDTTIQCNTRHRRFFVGARVLVFPATASFIPTASATIRTIESLTASSLTLTAAVGLIAPADRYAVVPLLDCERMLDPSVLMLTDTLGEVTLTVREVHSKNALPPLQVGQPDGVSIRAGYPVFEPDPNWQHGLDTAFLRYGTEQRQGVRLTTETEGERYVLDSAYNLSPLDRAGFSYVAGFFDSRRGRARAFWVVDRHDNYVPISNLSNTIFVEPLGTFADFEELWTEQHIGAGIVLADGTVYTPGVFSVSDNGSTWALTLRPGETLPILDMSQVVRFGRARLSRFQTDAMRETWHNTDVCEIRLHTVEVPNEKPLEF